MHDMTEMSMPLPDNTAPMMAGQGPFGAIGMGGMFSVLKVRDRLPAGWKPGQDIGWYRHPAGTVAAEWTGPTPPAAAPAPAATAPAKRTVQVRKPTGHDHH